MSTFLDDETIDLPQTSLAAAVAAAQERLHTDGRLIVEVQLDGEKISPEQIEEQQANSIEGKELRFYSANPRELASEAIQQARLLLGEAGSAQQEAADLLQQDEPTDALQRISLAMGAWQQAQQAVLNGSLLVGVDLDDLTFEDQSVTLIVNELLEQFQQLKTLISSGDTVALADALAYEWSATTERWDRLMGHLAQTIEAS